MSKITYKIDNFINITEEDIERAIKYIKSDNNKYKDLQKYKNIPDNELAKIILNSIRNEVYETLQKISKKFEC